jgi:hypothetical protein
LTKKRSDILVEKLKKEGNSKYEILKYNGANVKIISSKIKEYSDKLIELKED